MSLGHKISREDGIYCVIFVPTRELCMQVEGTLKKCLAKLPFIVGGCLMGGESVKKEKERLRKGLNIIICTPGWMLYHLKNTQALRFDHLNYFIFDEADRILDLGFEREMKDCMNLIKSKNRTLYKHQAELKTKDTVHVILVSATLDHKIEALSKELMDEEIRVGFDINQSADDKLDLSSIIPVTITQYYMLMPLQFKMLYLLSFLVANKD
jgi:ATP-dependent RNA helicase DDX31/DBP7